MECEICHGSRWKSVTVDGVERLTRCDCWRGDLVERLLKDARVPSRYARCELATFEHDMDTQREAFRRATRFVEAFPAVDRGLLLYGPHGVGKTHLAAGILKEVIRTKGARGFFFETRELLRLVRETFNRGNEETEMDVLAPVLNADLLVLDDLGAEKTSEWVQETLGLVVNTRYNAQRRHDLHQQSRRLAGQHRSARLHLPAGRPDAVAAGRNVRLGGDSGRGCARGRATRLGRKNCRMAEEFASFVAERTQVFITAAQDQGDGPRPSQGFRPAVRAKLVRRQSRK